MQISTPLPMYPEGSGGFSVRLRKHFDCCFLRPMTNVADLTAPSAQTFHTTMKNDDDHGSSE
jgi:hypothetical protein